MVVSGEGVSMAEMVKMASADMGDLSNGSEEELRKYTWKVRPILMMLLQLCSRHLPALCATSPLAGCACVHVGAICLPRHI